MLHTLRNAIADGADTLERRLNEDRVELAVTGLSRAGKTVFVTSLIANLLAAGHGARTLPKLQDRLARADGASRLHGVRILGAGTSALPHFDFDAKFARLAEAAPAWPERTGDLATIGLELALEPEGALRTRLGRRRLRLDILDYPGEWLLDMPLRASSYRAWSEATLAQLREVPRAALFAPFLDFLAAFDGSAPPDEGALRRGHALYRDGLRACQTRFGLRDLQPGRFLAPGPQGDLPFMWFFPAPPPGRAPARGSAAELLERRFDTYRAHVGGFFDRLFGRADAHVVLVDVLGALHAGRAAFADTERAIAALSGAMAAGAASGRLARAATRRRPPAVVFVATKADHVPAMRRENLRNLLRAVSEGAGGTLGARLRHRVAASVLSTEDGVREADGRAVEVVVGQPLGDERRRPFDPGDVPSGRPPESFWSGRFFELPVFRPPPIDPTGRNGVPQLGLDEILLDLLEGRLG